MTRAEQEALDFLREFEASTRNYFLRKGVAHSELPSALLEAQWQLLHNILQSKLSHPSRQQNYRKKIRGRISTKNKI